MAKDKGKLNRIWNALDEQYRIVETAAKENYCFISYDDIHDAGDYEPRLITHFNERRQMPQLFTDNGLSILPKGKGYVIGSFDPFVDIDDDRDTMEVHRYSIPPGIESFNHVTNEQMGIHRAEACGIIKDFIGEEGLTPTVCGRHGAGDWTYAIKSKGQMLSLNSENPQIEVDGGYESAESLVLIEAKNRIVDQFCLRQLYFPFRAWGGRVDKPVRTLLLAISGPEYYIYEYEFPDPDVFHGERIRAIHYAPDSQRISTGELHNAWKNAVVTESNDKGIPFPQANNIETTMNIIAQIAAGNEAGETVDNYYLADLCGFNNRQGRYYGDAAAYLGFARPIMSTPRKSYIITERGEKYLRSDARAQKLEFFKALVEHSVFHTAYGLYLEYNSIPSEKYVARLIHDNWADLCEETCKRRAQTVIGWIKWAEGLSK